MIYQVMAENSEINANNVKEWLQVFKTCILPERIKYDEYYEGKNCIIKQGAVTGRPNYSINVNMAKYIIDVATSYTFGIPVAYDTQNDNAKKVLDKVKYIHKNCVVSEVDFEQGGDMATYGVSYQLVMVLDGEAPIEDRIVFKTLEPLQTFYVIDNTILNNPICAVYFYSYKEDNVQKTRVYVYDKENLYEFVEKGGVLSFIDSNPHFMGHIPVIQCLNNDDAFSDIQAVTGLLDSLSLSVSNSTDNLQSIANAILAVSGGTLNEKQIELINELKVANLPVGATMEWIIKNINPEAEKQHVDNLLKFLFQISQVPDLTDEAFASNQSGVAMKYKLWGLDQLWGTKTIKYKKAIVHRLKILMHLLQYQFTSTVQMLDDITITFDKNLPTDNSAEYQMVQALKGVVADRTLLQNVSIVEDVEKELEELEKQAKKNADLYGFNNNTDLDAQGGEDGEE